MSDSSKGTLFLKRTQIVITFPDGRQEVHPLLGKSIRIGRGSENNDIAIPQEFTSISRRHLEIQASGAEYRLVDLGSTNGVYVNGEIVGTAALKNGDEIRIGKAGEREEVIIQFQASANVLASEEISEQKTIPFSSELTTDAPSEHSPSNHPLPERTNKLFCNSGRAHDFRAQ
jgi:pSer/pThr/pTyr-binding forkhead associated (FHA) protein